MVKKLLKIGILSMLVMIGSSVPMDVFAGRSGIYEVQDAEYQLTYSIDEEQECATITGHTGTVEGKLILPDEIEGYPVTSIGEDAFEGCVKLEEIRLPESLTSIGEYAFWECTGLSGSLQLPEGLTSIGEGAFAGCTGLSGSLQLPESLTSIGGSAFAGCEGLSGSLQLPEGLTSIEVGAFESCRGLSGSLQLPEGLTNIGTYAFWECRGLSGSLQLPEGLTSIGDYAFAGCEGLSGSLQLPEDLTSIGDGAFFGCEGLSGSLQLPEGLTSIGYNVFGECRGLSGSLQLPEGLTSIGDSAFSGCEGFSGNLVLPEGLTSIGRSAFADCSGLQKIIIPASVTYMEGFSSNLFAGCDQLTIYCKENSTAHKYAVEKEMQYVLMKEEQESIRVSGTDRNTTSRQVAMQLKEVLGVEKFETAIIAVGKDKKEADALAGSYLAKAKNAPILLTNGTDNVNTDTVQYICKNVKDHATIYILGGEATLSKTLDAVLEDLGYEVKRLAGNDRYATNIAVLKEAGMSGQTDLLIAVGNNFADSLSASATGKAILLVRPEKKGQLPQELTEDQKAVLEAFKDGNIYILGGTGAVGTKTVEKIAECIGKTSAELECNRISGATRYETSVKIAEKFFPNADEIVLAYGKKAADGLSGGPLAAALGMPLILTKAGDSVASDYAKSQKITSGYVLGGTAALDEETVNRIF